jgi:hypothetical protein
MGFDPRFCLFDLSARIHPVRRIGFIEEAKTADTTSKGYPIQTQRHTDYNTTQTDETTRTRLIPSSAKNGEKAIQRASRPRHN